MEIAKLAVALSLVSLIVAAGGVGYLAMNIQGQSRDIEASKKASDDLRGEVGKLSNEMREVKNLVTTMGKALGIENPEAAQRLAEKRAKVDALVAAAKREGVINYWFGQSLDAVKQQIAAFNAKYPEIKVNPTRADQTVLAQRFMTELRAGRTPEVDVFDVGNVNGPVVMDEFGKDVFIRYEPMSIDELIPVVKQYDLYPNIVPYQIRVYANLYNTKLVKPQDAPKTFKELADPKWKGKIVAHFPGGGLNWLSQVMILSHGGDEAKWTEWLKRFAANEVLYLSAFPNVVDSVIKGERLIGAGIGYPHVIEGYKTGGAPIDWVQMGESYYGFAGTVAIPSKSQHPNAAKLFVEFLLSKDGQQVTVEQDALPVHKDVPPKAKYTDIDPRLGKIIITGPLEFHKNRERYLKTIRDVVGLSG